ncbi:hypothetical protein HLB23_03235 [Nocardia uniformis]|uniref:Uncharacterized protein n=1 Tax=Nocardia uniformis TaxID=53432 RepID=A0A849BV05_9NOCA|nr:hypothetical protein [Nocardia uniformis]NNH68898.1 hypothetical protein [Nocardia uniformis]
MTITQGQLWKAVSPIGAEEATVVILEAQPAMLGRRRLLAARVRPEREVPEAMKLLTVPIDGGLSVAVYDISPFDKGWLKEPAGHLTTAQLGRLKVALRARFDL